MLNWTPDLPQRGELANNITRLLTDVNLKAEDIVHQLGIDNLYSFTKSVGTDWLLQRSRRKYDLLKLLPEIKLTEDEVSSIQNELINNNYSDFLKLLNDHGNKIQENYGGNQNFKINLQDNMLTKLQTNITIEEMEKTIRALFTLGMTSQLINNLYNALIELANRGEEFKNLVKKITKVKKNFEVFNEDQRKVLSAL